ncbi:LysE family translocator [Nonomuraea soli]|uniref:Threonine/homoserine/homoserine lactone efflux protein n=1 Tax=Nonomuraea soli TaxID=1032476 RepID=A0A7W0CPS1_9ACTN|nr:LysE family translocator [Nonomuraea soli]MBA2895081.1 threonine/homoserine/homoserine lactone efflux protein [Nonomuraea soli]
MDSLPQILAFAGVVMLGSMSPGPDFAVVVRRSVQSGRGHGMAAAAGIAVGVFFWVVAAATGIAALLAASALAFTVVKVVGAAYLLYLGVRAWLAAGRTAGPDASGAPARGGRVSAFSEGLLTNALNPKVAIFMIALVPQFVSAGAGMAQVLTLSAAALVTNALWFGALANLVAVLRRFLARRRVRRAVDYVTGTALIGLGVHLAVSKAP